jgi:NADPH:quinone reductase-like Zn-dependent oxidoreductase/acyl carrier protein
VYLWALELPSQIAPTASLTEQIGLAWKAPLFLIQALQQQTVSERFLLDFVTRGACAVTSNSQPTIQAAPLFGLAKSLLAEVSNFSCRVIDLEHNVAGLNQAAEASLLFLDAVQAAEQPLEDQLAYRNSLRYAPRLKRLAPAKPVPTTPGYQLTIPVSGSLGDLAWQACERAEPQAGEVEIEVHATGLNFKDVLLALHRVPAMGDGLGVECAGRVVKLGPGVTEFALGERVLAMVPGSLSRFICAPVATTVSLPATMDDRAAATIPITFLTAAYALESLAHLRPGERVLIHAATGGVGQAAIQIAQAAGAVVFATASQGKWQILKDLGVEHIFDSRTTEFEAAIQALTHGEGLDVVLNSLRGEFTDASLRLLRAGGRFLEIGITDLRTPAQIAQFSTAIEYFPIDLMVLYREQRQVLQALLRKLLERFATNELKPLPYQTFAAEAVETAFRTMQQAKHTGKVIIDMQQHAVISNDPNGQYLILGGLGDLGLSLATWLVEQNAQHICLVARSTPTPDKQAQLDALREAGATITVLQADITAPNDVARFVRQLKESGQRLRGIFHCASVLDDGVLSQQSVERFDKVLRSKIDSTWLVHQQTLDLPLDFFVLFSSATALLGAPGQANYAAANAFLDSFAQYRRSTGRAALAIDWGAWAEIGLAARMSSPLNLAKQGIKAMPPRLALAALGHAMHHHGAQLGVLDIDWRTYQLNKKPQAFLAAFQEESTSQTRQATTNSLLNDLATANAEDRATLILQLVEQNIVAVLSLPKSRSIDRKQGFLDMGMDSLTAVELKNRLNRELMVPLPATLAFDYPNTASLANYLVSKINEKFPLVDAKKKDSRDADTLAIEQLSEQEAAEELRKTLKDMGFGD